MTPMELDSMEQRKKEARQKGLCFNCGYKGHMARDCRKPKAKINQMETEDTTTSSSSSTAEFVRLEENKEQLLRFNGKINGKTAWILLDSGASRNFVDKKFVAKHHMKANTTSPLTVELADRRKKEVTTEVKFDKLELGKYRTTGVNA